MSATDEVLNADEAYASDFKLGQSADGRRRASSLSWPVWTRDSRSNRFVG